MKQVIKNTFERMQKGTVVTLCIVCMLSSLISGCEQNDLKDESNILQGKWQLKAIKPPNAEGVTYMLVDFSPMNIIYEFKANNVLTVSGNVDNDYGGLNIGKHFYEITLTEVINDPLGLPAPHEVRINGISYGFSFGYMSDSPGMVMVCRDECNSAFYFVKK